MFTCVRWQVSRSNPIWQVMLHSSAMSFQQKAIHPLNFYGGLNRDAECFSVEGTAKTTECDIMNDSVAFSDKICHLFDSFWCQ